MKMTEEEFQESFKHAPPELIDLPLWGQEDAHRLLCEICTKHSIDPRVITELVKWERKQRGNTTKRGRTEDFNAIFESTTYWQEEE